MLSKYLPTLVVAALAFTALPRARATQTITINSAIDTYIQMGEAIDHQNDTTPLHVRGGASQQRLTYLKFTVPFSAAASGGGSHDIAAGNLNATSSYKIRLQIYKNTPTPAAGVTPSCIISLHPVANGWWQPTARETAVADFDGAHYGTVVPAPLSTPIASLNSFDGTLPSGPGYITFDVTSYVTGPGDYSFCLQTTSTTDINFKSFDSQPNPTNPPKLVFTVGATLAEDRVYFRRYPSEVLDAGAAIVSRYIAFNSAATPTGDYDVNKIGYIDATKQPYNLKGGGNASDATDNYFALQRAVNEARDARCAVYIPPGRYVIDQQVQLIQGLVPYESTPYANTFGERWDINDFPCVLIGYGNDPSQRSTLILKSGSTGFGSTTTPKSMLYFWSRWNNYTGSNVNTPPTWNRLASHFDATLANIDLELNSATTGSLNTGAIGVDMGGAQGTSIHDVNVKATGAFAGFRALPGPGGLTHSVSVTDGAYGLYCVGAASNGPGQSIGADTAISTVVAASTFTNQSVNAVNWQGLQGLVLVGCDIVSPADDSSETPIWVEGTNRLQGNVTIVESRISRAGAGPLVKGNRSVYLRDVYGNFANPVVDVMNVNEPGRTPPAGFATGWTWVQECWDGVIIDQNADSAPAAYVKTRIAGQADSQRGILKKQVTLADIPSDLLSRHVPTATPRWNQANVINVKDAPYSAIGDGASSNSDGAKIQNALDDAGVLATEGTPAYVFIPRGDFFIEAQASFAGLKIPNNVIVFGIDKSFSRLKAQPEIAGPLVTAGEGDARDRGARTMLADLMLLQKMGPSSFNDNTLLEWKVGRHSVVRNVNFDRRNNGVSGGANPLPLVLITGNGGGRWYDFWNDSDAGQASGYRHIKISGTSEPLKFYMLNAETDTDVPQVEIVNAGNVQIFQTKWEGAAKDANNNVARVNAPVLDVSNSTDISVFGFSGNAELDDDGSNPLNADDYVVKFNSGDRLLAAQNNFQKSTADEDHYGWLRDAGPTTITTPHNEQFVLYRRNNPRRFALIPSEAGNTDGWMLGPVAGPASSFGASGGGSQSLRIGDDGAATPKQYRSIVSFDVRQVPDGATIHSMKLRLRVGDVPTNLAAINDVILEVRQNSTDAENIFSTSADLQNADFAGPTSGANTVVTVNTVSVTGVLPYQVLEITIPSGFYNYVKPSGVGRTRVQFRLKPSTSPGAGTADILGFYAGDTANVDYKPILEIVYTP